MHVHPAIVSETDSFCPAETKRDKQWRVVPLPGATLGVRKMGKPRKLNDREKLVLDRVELLLKSRSLSWSELARAVGKTTSSASQWSGRLSFPREQTLYSIAQQLGVGMGWLLAGDETDENLAPRTVTERDLMRVVKEMSPDEQRALLGAARGLKGTITKK